MRIPVHSALLHIYTHSHNPRSHSSHDKTKSRSTPSSDTNPIGPPPVSDPPALHPGPDRGPAPLIPVSVSSRDGPSSGSGARRGRDESIITSYSSTFARGPEDGVALLEGLPGGASGFVVAGLVSARVGAGRCLFEKGLRLRNISSAPS